MMAPAAERASDPVGLWGVVSIGVGGMVGGGIFAVLGLAPLTGVPLPFISYGSTNLMVLLAGMGLLLNVADGGRVRMRVVTGSKGASSDRSRRDSRPRGTGAGRSRRAAS